MAEVPGAQRPVLAGGPEPRDPLDCWACAVLVTAQNLLVAVFNLLLLALVLGTILLPAVIMLGFGFLCHSQVSIPRGMREWCVGGGGGGVSEPLHPHLGCFLLGRVAHSDVSYPHSFCALRHPCAPRICGTQASQPCWSLDSYCSCRCLSLPWLPTAASACASAWPTASCPTAEPSTGAGASHSRSKSQSHQVLGLFPHRERSGSEVLRVKNPVDCPPGLSRT